MSAARCLQMALVGVEHSICAANAGYELQGTASVCSWLVVVVVIPCCDTTCTFLVVSDTSKVVPSCMKIVAGAP